jgi:hypothetical protein
MTDAEKLWDPIVLTEALVVSMFTLNQDVKLDKSSLVVQDARIFPTLLNIYLNNLLLQSNSQFQSQQLDRIAYKLLTKVFRLSFGIVSQAEGSDEFTLSAKLNATA